MCIGGQCWFGVGMNCITAELESQTLVGRFAVSMIIFSGVSASDLGRQMLKDCQLAPAS